MGLREQFQDKADRMKEEARKRVGGDADDGGERADGPSDGHARQDRDRPADAGPRAQAGEAGERMRDESDRARDRAEGRTKDTRERRADRVDG